MAILHDLPESIVGDLTPSASEFIDKQSIEKKVASNLFLNKQDFLEIFLEYQENKTDEAKLVHDADKLQMMIRANRYKRQNKGDMDRFSGVEFHYSIFYDILSSFINLDGDKNIK
ncbi:MAG: HD domain-containing protein [Caldisericia bacterium]